MRPKATTETGSAGPPRSLGLRAPFDIPEGHAVERCLQCLSHQRPLVTRSYELRDNARFGSETSQTALAAGREKYHRAKGQVCATNASCSGAQQDVL